MEHGLVKRTGRLMLLVWVVALHFALTGMAGAQTGGSGNVFNPDISLILNGTFSSYSEDPEDLNFAAYLPGEEAGPPEEGFSLGETELVLSSNVDDWFYGFVTVALVDEDDGTEVELEEAWLQTLALPHGLSLKAGKFFSDIGYHNNKHPHSWDFVDAPLAYQALLNNTYLDTGVQLRWLAPADLMIELGGELVRGDEYPAAGAENDGTGAFTLFAKIGGDVGVAHSWLAGLSYLSADAEGRDSSDGDLAFSGDSEVLVANFVWKWALNGNPRERNFVFQTEYLYRDEDGELESVGAAETADYDGTQKGFYAQGVYQFRRRWRVGLRYDLLDADNDVAGVLIPGLPENDDDPWRVSAMLDYSHSEYSRLRLQVGQVDDGTDDGSQVFLQYIMSLGAHGAHQF